MKYREKEKGVALLLALGFAALLLVLIMGFATNALIDRKVAVNNGDKSQARSIAMSALNRAVVAMQYMMHSQINNAVSPYDLGLYRFDNIVSKYDTADETSGSELDNADLESVFHKDGTGANAVYSFKYRDNVYIYQYPEEADRDYSYNKETVSDSRNTYLRPQWQNVKDGEGKLIGRFMYAALPDLGRVYKSVADGVAQNDTKGRTLKEFSVEKGFGIPDTVNIDKYRHPAEWSVDTDIVSDSTRPNAFFLFNSFEMDSDISGDGTPRNKKFRNEDNTFTGDMVNVFTMPQTVGDLIDAVPYLNKIDADDKTAKEKQIAANLIMAFNPPSGGALTDDVNNPTYMGNGRTPYINEMELLLRDLSATVTVTTTKDSNGNDIKNHEVTPKITVALSAELNNPYKIEGNYAVKSVSGSLIQIEFYVKNAVNQALSSLPEIADGTIDGDLLYPNLSVSSEISGTAITLPDVKDSYKIYAKVKFLPKAWKLMKGSDTVDFVNILDADVSDPTEAVYATAELTVNADGTLGTVPVNKYISFQVKDSRMNLNNSQWSRSESDSSNIGSLNNRCISGDSDGDGTDDNNGVVISEYFPDVAGDKDKISLADLMCISKEVVGKTFDIFNNEDKELFDQLTTYDTTAEPEPQLIDINTRSIRVWKGLLANVKGRNGSPELLDTDEKVEAVAKSISKSIRSNNVFFKRRSDSIDVIRDALTENGYIDVDSPLLIGKMLPLCKTEDYPEYAYVVIVAQTISKNQSSTNLGKWEADKDTITSEVRYLAKLHRKKDNKMEIVWIEELAE